MLGQNGRKSLRLTRLSCGASATRRSKLWRCKWATRQQADCVTA